MSSGCAAQWRTAPPSTTTTTTTKDELLELFNQSPAQRQLGDGSSPLHWSVRLPPHTQLQDRWQSLIWITAAAAAVDASVDCMAVQYVDEQLQFAGPWKRVVGRVSISDEMSLMQMVSDVSSPCCPGQRMLLPFVAGDLSLLSKTGCCSNTLSLLRSVIRLQDTLCHWMSSLIYLRCHCHWHEIVFSISTLLLTYFAGTVPPSGSLDNSTKVNNLLKLLLPPPTRRRLCDRSVILSVIMSFCKQDNWRTRERTSTKLGRHRQGMTL